MIQLRVHLGDALELHMEFCQRRVHLLSKISDLLRLLRGDPHQLDCRPSCRWEAFKARQAEDRIAGLLEPSQRKRRLTIEYGQHAAEPSAERRFLTRAAAATTPPLTSMSVAGSGVGWVKS